MEELVGSVSAGDKRERHIRNLREMQEAAACLKSVSEGAEVVEAAPGPARRQRASNRWLIIMLLLLLAATGLVWWLVLENSRKKEQLAATQNQQEIRVRVEEAILARQWARADELLIKYAEAGAPVPKTQELTSEIVEGKMAAKRQRLAYLAGDVRVKAESALYEEAEESLAEITLLDPEYEERDELRKLITEGRNGAQVAILKEQIAAALSEDDLNKALLGLNELQLIPGSEDDHAEMSAMLKKAESEKQTNKKEADRLTALARELDKGEFSPEAMDYLRRALALDPANQSAKLLLDKITAYGRNLKVPENYATLEALNRASLPNDTVTIAAGKYEGTLILKPGMNIRGAGFDKSEITYTATQGSVLVFHGEKGESAAVSGLRLTHRGGDTSDERFAVISVSQSQLQLAKVKVLGGAGHGMVVMNGGRAEVLSSRFSNNGWDGVAVVGEGSTLQLRDAAVSENLNSGIAAWGGGALDIEDCHIYENVLSGISAGGAAKHRVHDVRLEENRDAGLLVGTNAEAEITEVTARRNLNGGFVTMEAGKVSISRCQARRNGFGGYVFAKGAEVLLDTGNTGRGNGVGSTDLRKVNVEFADPQAAAE